MKNDGRLLARFLYGVWCAVMAGNANNVGLRYSVISLHRGVPQVRVDRELKRFPRSLTCVQSVVK